MTGGARPKYQRIADDLRAQIESGDYPPGSQLPSKAALKEKYQVAQNTVDGALRELVREGLIQPRQGAGTFVCDPPDVVPPEHEVLRSLIEEVRGEVCELRERVTAIERARGQ